MAGRPRTAVLGAASGGVAPGSTIVTGSGINFAVNDDDAGQDFYTGAGNQMLVGFDTTDPAKCVLYPPTTAFGQEVIGVPKGTVNIRLISTGADFTLEGHQETTMPQYGGAPGSLYWADNANVCRRNVAIEPIDMTSVGSISMFVRYRSDIEGVAQALAYLSNDIGPAVATNGAMYMGRGAQSAPPKLVGQIYGNGGASQVRTANDSMGDWSLGCLTFDATTGFPTVQNISASTYAVDQGVVDTGGTLPTFNYLTIGALPTTGGNPLEGYVAEVCVVSGLANTGLTEAQLTAVYNSSLMLPDAIKGQDASAVIRAYVSGQQNDPWRERILGNEFVVDSGSAGNAIWISTDYSHSGVTGRLVPNRLAVAASVKQQAYTSSALVTKLPWAAVASDYGCRFATVDALTADYGTPPDADGASTFTVPAGVSIQPGGPVTSGEYDFKSSSATGTAYLVAIEYQT